MVSTALHSRTLHPEPGARPLYLGHQDRKQVGCTDCALVVTNSRKQVTRYPVVRIARVVSSTQAVDWSGNALALCMRAGIGITWIDTNGRIAGTMYTQTKNPTPIHNALEIWLDSEQSIEKYQSWLQSRRMKILIRWIQNQNPTIDPQEWENKKQQYVYNGKIDTKLAPLMRELCQSTIAAALNKEGIRPIYYGPETTSIDLDEDLCDLIWAEMNLVHNDTQQDDNPSKNTVQKFEKDSTWVQGALMEHLVSLAKTALRG